MSDMSIVGQPGKFGLGVMMKKADSMGEEFVQALCAQIEGRPDAAVIAATTEKHRLSSAQMAIAAAIGATIIVLVFYFLTR